MKTVIKTYLIKFCNIIKTLIVGLIKFFNNFIEITNPPDSHMLQNTHTQYMNYRTDYRIRYNNCT